MARQHKVKAVKASKATEDRYRSYARALLEQVRKAVQEKWRSGVAPAMYVSEHSDVTVYDDGRGWVTVRMLVRPPKPRPAKKEVAA